MKPNGVNRVLANAARNARYNRSPKGRWRSRRYNETAKGRERRWRFELTEWRQVYRDLYSRAWHHLGCRHRGCTCWTLRRTYANMEMLAHAAGIPVGAVERFCLPHALTLAPDVRAWVMGRVDESVIINAMIYRNEAIVDAARGRELYSRVVDTAPSALQRVLRDCGGSVGDADCDG